jgi:hypothetical protein
MPYLRSVFVLLCVAAFVLHVFDAASAAEQRCGELGSNCICSEPLEATAYTLVQNSIWNPNDSTTKQCSQLNGGATPGAALVHGQTPLAGSDASVLNKLPAGHNIQRYLRGAEGHTSMFDLLGEFNPNTFPARVAARWYLFYSPNFQFSGGSSACLNSGKWIAPRAGFLEGSFGSVNSSRPVPNDAYWTMYGWGGDSSNSWLNQTGASGADPDWGPGADINSEPIGQLIGKWWRVEAILTNNTTSGVSTLKVYRKNITDNGPEYKVVDTTIPCTNPPGGPGCSGSNLPNWTSAVANNLRVPPTLINRIGPEMFRNGTCAGYFGASHYMVAGWSTNAGQRIGPAYEVEGTGATPPPAPTPTPPPPAPIPTPPPPPPPPPPASTTFQLNDRVQVVNGNLNVRSTPSTAGALLGSQPVGGLGTVIGGPTAANGFNWWNINYDSAPDGWSVEDNLQKVIGAPSCAVAFSPTSGPAGTNPIMTWSSQNDADSQLAYNCGALGAGNLPSSGSQTAPLNTTTFCTLTAVNTSGQSSSCSATFTVSTTPPPPAYTSFYPAFSPYASFYPAFSPSTTPPPPPGTNHPYFNSTESGCGTDSNVMLCDDFEDGIWYMTDGDHMVPENDGWFGNIYANPITPANAIRCGTGTTPFGNCAADGGLHLGVGGRNMAQHRLKTSTCGSTGVEYCNVNELYVRWYAKWDPGYLFAGEKHMVVTNSDGDIAFAQIDLNCATSGPLPTVGVNIGVNYGTVNEPGNCGPQNQGNNITIQSGRWYFFEFHVRAGSNALMELWINDCGTTGTACGSAPILRTRLTGSLPGNANGSQIQTLWLENWANSPAGGSVGNGPLWDQIKASRVGPIGFSGSTGTTPPPSPTPPPPAYTSFYPAFSPYAAFSPYTSFSPSAPLPGDLNADGGVNAPDLQLEVNVILGTETSTTIRARADLNGDGSANALDLQRLVNLVLGL